MEIQLSQHGGVICPGSFKQNKSVNNSDESTLIIIKFSQNHISQFQVDE